MAVLDKLLEKQAASGMTDERFAEHLGINKGVFSRVKRGQRGISKAFYGAITRTYPELSKAVMDELWGEIETAERHGKKSGAAA
jgi:hypothetical protein